MKIIEDKTFKDLTTFRVGGKIKYYVEVKNTKEIAEAIKFSKEEKLNIFILGGGSDILASDKEYKGLVIKYIKKGYKLEGEKINVFAGTDWDELVKYTIEKGLQGLESLSGIPGTVGAAPIQNIGAYGSEVADHFLGLKAYDLKDGKFVEFNKKDCKFGYRESIFKSKDYWQRFLITDVIFSLNKSSKAKVNYESLKGVVNEYASIKEIRDAVLKIRTEKLENPKEHGNAGSFFKNPVIDLADRDVLVKNYPDAKIYPYGKLYKVSAGWLIEKAGLKGKKLGGAAVSPKHSLILINENGKATTKEIYDLSEDVINKVNENFGIILQREVQLINFD